LIVVKPRENALTIGAKKDFWTELAAGTEKSVWFVEGLRGRREYAAGVFEPGQLLHLFI
jgi:hypothetical protein